MASHLPICVTCGTQYGAPRPDCPICEDERQYVPRSGQQWTTLAELRAGEHTFSIEEEGPGVTGIGVQPKFGIGQRALLVRAASGNILWDCVPYLDDDLIGEIRELGGISAIAISHPHYYTTMVEWADAFDVPIHLHEKDQQWIGRPDPRVRLWRGGEHRLADDLTLVNLGVHFAGGTVLHWRDGAEGKGALLSGDIVQVVPNHDLVAFMYSYPNYLPERPSIVRRAGELLAGYTFDEIYGAWWAAVVRGEGNEVVRHSVERYLDLVSA
ncbi:MBL fold metallo-hydrolase [Qaidamihabitans albus]|uniref:MBL fold metallo-hydrolase n=1 Tax=Qaidamihabitans albus TaxID=2795733 RepID=UPI0018F23FEB|nr:MBL fold metallo-hydrolase [Qaidamihabitans albus]